MPKRKKTSSPPAVKQQPTEPPQPKCFVCEKDFPTALELENHIVRQHGPRFNCQCAHCTGKRRHDSAKLVEESTSKDDGKDVKLFKCIVCNYHVFLLCKCLSHIQMVHNTVPLTNQFECMKCNLGFATCTELNDHIQTHAGAQKIARCGFQHCKKCFTTATMLKTHLKNCHKITKPYEYLNNVKGSLVNPKAPNMVLNNSSNRSVSSRVNPVSSTYNATLTPSTSAWTSPDPSSPPRAGNTPDTVTKPPQQTSPPPDGNTPDTVTKPPQQKTEPKVIAKQEEPLNPHWTCKQCNKEHKSQTSFNNHMVVFHKQKFSAKAPSGSKKKRRRQTDDDSDVSSDWTSEDSDWEPSNTRRRTYTTRRSTKVRYASGGSDAAPTSNTDEGNHAEVASSSNTNNNNDKSGDKRNGAPALNSPSPSTAALIKAANQVVAASDSASKTTVAPPAATTPSNHSKVGSIHVAAPPHGSHTDNAGHQDCLACQQERQPIPVVRIKQEPGVEPPMPIISNVFSMTNAAGIPGSSNQGGNIIPQTTSLGYGNANPYIPIAYPNPTQLIKNSQSNTGYDVVAAPLHHNQFESGDERPASAASSSLHNGSGFSSTSNTPQITPNRGSPPSGPSLSGWQSIDQTECVSCLTKKPNQNKCVHCGIIFMEPTMHMIHMGWHGKEHPFQCHTCGHICKDKYSFTTHIFKAPHL